MCGTSSFPVTRTLANSFSGTGSGTVPSSCPFPGTITIALTYSVTAGKSIPLGTVQLDRLRTAVGCAAALRR